MSPERFKLVEEVFQAAVVLERTGNTSSASIPLALVDAIDHDRVHEGDLILHNDPAFGGSHAIDVCMYKPVFYDGKLRWSDEAKKALWSMKDAYTRRRTKARVEKGARLRKLAKIGQIIFSRS